MKVDPFFFGGGGGGGYQGPPPWYVTDRHIILLNEFNFQVENYRVSF